MKRLMISALSIAIVGIPAVTSAQIGMLGKRLMGVGGGTTISTESATGFLTNATQSTKNVMISAALLSQAVTNRGELGGRKAEILALQNAQDIKELDAHKSGLQSDLSVLNGRSDLAADLSTAYNSGNAQQKKLIYTAVGNLAIGVLRNTQLAGQSPDMVKGIGSNPDLITRAGQFKMAAGLIGMQAKGLGGIATAMPKLLTVVKAKAPSAGSASDPQPVSL